VSRAAGAGGWARRAWARRAARALAAGEDPLRVAARLARPAGALVRLLVRRAEAELGPPPAPFAWLALGGVGRREGAPGADLDHALVYAATGPAGARWFANAAARVTRGLAQAGVPACPGGWSADRRQGDLEAWVARLQGLSADASPAALLDLAVFLDHRRVAGQLEVGALGEACVPRAPVRAALGEAALLIRCRAPLRVRLAPRRPLDVKAEALAPLVAAARALALAAAGPRGRVAGGTLARLEAARAGGLLGADTAARAAAALRCLTGLRLRTGLEAVLAGAAPSTVVVPAALAAVERARLLEALAAVRAVQRRLGAAVG